MRTNKSMIYFRGCTAREKETSIKDATEMLLDLAGVDYRVLDDEKCCGSVLLRTGFVDEAQKQIQKNSEVLKFKIQWLLYYLPREGRGRRRVREG